MPDYRITINLRMGEAKTGIRFDSRHNIEDVTAHFQKKVYDYYSKYLVNSIPVEKITEEGEKHYDELSF